MQKLIGQHTGGLRSAVRTHEASSTVGPGISKLWYCLAFVSLWNGGLGTSCPTLPICLSLTFMTRAVRDFGLILLL